MTDKQNNNDGDQSLLHVNDMPFIQIAHGDDYVLYQAQEQRTLGDIIIDLFLENVPDKGWWGAVRLNNKFRIQFNIDRKTLFPTPEIALLATEEFLAHEQHVHETLEDMRKNKLDLQTFQHMPLRPASVDPEKYFSPPSLDINGNFFTLYHLTKTEAAYRSWGKRRVAEIAVDLRLVHVYWKGWQAGLRFFDSRTVMFEPALDQLFATPEEALTLLLTFSSEEESMRNLVQQLQETQDRIMVRREVIPLVTAKPPLHVDDVDFVWQKQISEGNLYQAQQAIHIDFKKLDVQLVETWRKGWLGGLQPDDFSGVYFEKEVDTGFSTPEEALAEVREFAALKKDALKVLRDSYILKTFLQCQIGKYNQIMSIRTSKEGK